MMPSCAVPLPRDEKSVLTALGIVLLLYYAIMDIILYRSLQGTTLTEPPSKEKAVSSPFHPLSVKLLMTDHTSHYIVMPTTEYFDAITHFSTVFYFITPNMITFTHLFVALISAKFISSESLHDRRIGVLFYEFRTWLDGFDGVVFRSHSGKRKYHSVRATSGYYIDTSCDIAGGVLMCFGILFFLFKYFDKKQQDTLPWTKNGENGIVSSQSAIPSRKVIFWKLFLFGVFMLAASSGAWDHVVGELRTLFETPLDDPNMTVLQTNALHSGSTFFLFWLWRIFEGQTLLQVILIAIFIDKIWEFLNLVQYIGQVIILSLYVITLIYIRHLRSMLHMK